MNEQVVSVLEAYQDFVISTDKERTIAKELKDYPCLGMVLFKFFSLDKAKDSLIGESSPSSVDALLVTNDCIVLIEFKNPWSEYIEKYWRALISEFNNERNFPVLNSTFIRKRLQDDERLWKAIANTVNRKFKLKEKFKGSCYIITKICEKHNLKVSFKVEFVVIVDVTEDFVNRVRSEPTLLRLRKLVDKRSLSKFAEKNIPVVVGAVKSILKEILSKECDILNSSSLVTNCKIVDCKCLDCGEFRLFEASIRSNVLFPK